MPGSLFDSNVWIASIFSAHPFHRAARQVLVEATPSEPAVFCRSTQLSFLRLASNPALLKAYAAQNFTNRDAWIAMEAILALPQVSEREEPPGLVSLWRQFASRDSSSPKLWMDSYLAAFAIAASLNMVTLDQDFRSFESKGLKLSLLS